MEFIVFVVLMGLFGRFVWSHFGQPDPGIGEIDEVADSVTSSNQGVAEERMERFPLDDDCGEVGMAEENDFGASPDYITDPTYSWMPGNIYYQESSLSYDSISGGYCGSDWMTDPACSHMPGNIFHDDITGSCSGMDWMTDPACSYMPGNIFNDDSVTSSSSDDSWSSPSCFDDSWPSSSTSDDW